MTRQETVRRLLGIARQLLAATPPSLRDQADAVEHASGSTDRDLRVDEFDLKYLSMMNVKELEQFDDIASWLEVDVSVDADERIEELESFRGHAWAKRAEQWIRDGIPPIIVVEVPDVDGQTIRCIGDGRGRVNVAALFNLSLPVWEMQYRDT